MRRCTANVRFGGKGGHRDSFDNTGRSNHGHDQTARGSDKGIVRFPLFQLAIVVAVILFLQAADDKSARGQMFNGLDKLVESTVGLFSALFNVKSFTKSW